MEEEKTCSCFCGCLDAGDAFWERYKRHSGKVSIVLSILGVVAASLSSQIPLAGTIATSITNLAIFFSGIAYEKLSGESKVLESDLLSLKNENQNLKERTEEQRTVISMITPKEETSSRYEEIKPFRVVFREPLIE
jgi:hypothetical protein